MENQRMTVIVSSCDKYSDVWADFFACKERNWPDCPYETVLVTNDLQPAGYRTKVLACGQVDWSTRMRLALESVDTKYVCFLMEDFLLCEKVDTRQITSLLDLMDADCLKYCKLCEVGVIATPYYKDYPYLRQIPENLRYGVSLMAAIWDRELFLEKLGDGDYNPWKFEADRNAEALNATQEVIGIYDERDILHICQLVVQGKIMPSAVRKLRKKGYAVQDTERPRLSAKESAAYYLRIYMARLSKKLPFIKKLARKLGYRGIGEN